MNVGDMVRHYDGDKGIIIGVDPSRDYPYRVWFFTNNRSPGIPMARIDWFIENVFRVISESR